MHDAVELGQRNFDQTASARTTLALATAWAVAGTMGGTQQKVTSEVKKAVGLIIHFHGNMGAAVEVGVRHPLVTYSKRSTRLPRIDNIERNGQAAILQISRGAQGNGRRIRHFQVTTDAMQTPNRQQNGVDNVKNSRGHAHHN